MAKQISDARSEGPANLNETTPPEQRKPTGADLGVGPIVGDKGEYHPATYEVPKNARYPHVSIVRTDR